MRKITFLVIFLGVMAAIFVSQNHLKTQLTTPTQSPEPNVLAFPEDGVYVEGPFDGSSVALINNLDKKLTAQEARKQYECKVLTNAAFYTKENQHVGLFVTDERVLRSAHESSLFNSYITINSFFTPRITRTEPLDVLTGVQSGPLLIENAKVMKLSIVRDKEARRVVAAVTGENKLMFLVFFNSNSYFSGPTLTDLPQKVKNVSDSKDLNIADAINLDGGSASTFLSDTVQLSELSPVGSFFCVR